MHRFFLIIFVVIVLQISIISPEILGKETSRLPSKRYELGLPAIKNFSPKDYAEHSQNWTVIQDDRGILYFGNGHGILEYDGISWRLIETDKRVRVRSFAKDKNGTIYVGASSDFGYLAPDSKGQMQYVSLLEHLNYEDLDFTEIWRTHVISQGIYFQTFDKLFRWADNRIRVWNSDSEFFLSSVIKDTLYLEHRQKGLMKLVGDSLRLIPAGKHYVPLRIMSILPIDNHDLLLCTSRQGLLLLQEGEIKPFPNECNAFLREHILSSATFLADSTIALGTYRGGVVVINQEGKWLKTFNRTAGLQENDVKYLYSDMEGILWLALNYGITQVNVSTPFSYFMEQQGISGLVSSLARFRGTLYTATSRGVYYLRTASAQINSSPRFLPVPDLDFEAFSLLPTTRTLLIGTNEGLYAIDSNTVNPVPGMKSPVFCLHRSRLDTTLLYAGLANGVAVFRYQKQGWKFAVRLPGITEEIRSIAEQLGGNLWLGTMQKGVLKVKIKTSKPEKPQNIERLAPEIVLPFGQIINLDDQILFATQQGLKFFNETTHTLQPSTVLGKELSENSRWISRIYILNARNYLIHSGIKKSGEYWLAQKDSNNFFEIDKNLLRDLLHFGTIYSSFTDENGIIWFGCNTGLVRFDPSQSGRPLTIPKPLIRRVLILPDSTIYGGGDLVQTSTFELPFRNNALRFEYVLPSFEETSDNQFQYMLEGFDQNWSDWTYENLKDYTNLPGGAYKFRLRARNVHRQQTEQNKFSFQILPPWYFSWWAYATYLILFLISLITIDRLQRFRVIKREQHKARIREAEIVHDKNVELRQVNTRLEELLKDLQNSQAEVIESESRFRSVAESANDAIITADQDGYIRFWNKRAEIIFGYTLHEIMGKPLTNLMPARHRHGHRKGMSRLIKTGETRISGKVLEIEAIRKSGEEFPIELTVSHWKTAYGIFVTGIIRDITKRKRQQEALEKTTTELEQAYQRKSEELEKARQLQLSMLPAKLPQLPHLEIDAYMKTATEVGGDYYDVYLENEQNLTVVIGDATGHGLEAGMLVTATKSLFLKLAEEPDIVNLIQQMNEALKRLKLKKLYMAFQVVRIKGYMIEVCTAGMPPLLIYKKQKNAVEEVLLKALPLGGFSGISYQKKNYSLSSGDVVLIFSDGFPERFNEQGEMFDYDRVKSVLQKAAGKSPTKIIEQLIRVGETWAGKQAQHDDETFVVLKMK